MFFFTMTPPRAKAGRPTRRPATESATAALNAAAGGTGMKRATAAAERATAGGESADDQTAGGAAKLTRGPERVRAKDHDDAPHPDQPQAGQNQQRPPAGLREHPHSGHRTLHPLFLEPPLPGPPQDT